MAEHRVPGLGEVVRRDRAGELRCVRPHEGDGDLGREVLEHHLEAWKVAKQRRQPLLDEHLLAVEDVDVRAGMLAVDEERHADRLHPCQHLPDTGEVGDAGRRVGGGVGRVELHRGQHAVAEAGVDVLGVAVVAEIGGHQRGERRSLGQRRQDAVAVACGVGRRRHRRQRLGITIARAKLRAVNGSTARSIAPSRTWTCQSSGARMVICSVIASGRAARKSGSVPS